jgi:hypothetical protein
MLWRRLEIIATEDVGFGLMQGPALIEALYQQQRRIADGGDRWMYPAHAIRLLATAKKDRTTMEMAVWAKEVLTRGERRIEIEDYHVDLHMRRAVEMGRDASHWWQDGSRLDNQIEGLPTKYGEYPKKPNSTGPSQEDVWALTHSRTRLPPRLCRQQAFLAGATSGVIGRSVQPVSLGIPFRRGTRF